MKDVAKGFGSQTNVGIGALAGSFATVGWWLFSVFTETETPDAVVAASVVLITAVLQFCIPARPEKNTRMGDKPNV